MSASKRLSFARDAVEAAAALLQTLPASTQRAQLLAEAERCRTTVDGWSTQSPSAEEHETTMKAILKLHMAAARLGRAARSGPRKP